MIKTKLVTITGGTKGVGAAIAKTFLDNGWIVVIGSRNKTGFAKIKHPRLSFKKIDVKNERDHVAFIKFALKKSKNYLCAINCAGISAWKPISQVTPRFWSQMIDTNLKGTFLGCKVASKYLNKKNSTIINISSLAGKRGSANNSVYCASKFAVNGLTQSLAKELGQDGIRVNAVCPVYIETPGLKIALGDENSPSKGVKIDSFIKEFTKKNSALNRMPTANEVSHLCYFLSSSEAEAITGQCINIDCGVLPQ
jgi:3-oxoacyl-[acyl-carrier protein] reductase/meso-butanediol dehydrogenase/(S,S)-butanediol dehydrogenase/diacetyl reductase